MTKQEKARARSKKLYREHLAYVKVRDKKYAEKHKDAISEYHKQWRKENAEKLRLDSVEYRRKNADKLRAYFRVREAERMKTDLNFRFSRTLRLRARQALKISQAKKSNRFNVLMGATIGEVRKHLEDKFTQDMTWENWGQKGWHVDHIVPLARFDLRNEQEQKIAFHYSNLQPLWAIDNIRKGAKI